MEALQSILRRTKEDLRSTTRKILEWTDRIEDNQSVKLQEIKDLERQILGIYRLAKEEIREAAEEIKVTSRR